MPWASRKDSLQIWLGTLPCMYEYVLELLIAFNSIDTNPKLCLSNCQRALEFSSIIFPALQIFWLDLVTVHREYCI